MNIFYKLTDISPIAFGYFLVHEKRKIAKQPTWQCQGGYLLAAGTSEGSMLLFDLRTFGQRMDKELLVIPQTTNYT